jgi:hypothetical protein
MHFTKEIRPYDIDNCATIMEWIKERRAYVKLPSHTSFVLWHTMASQPNFHELWVSGAVFKAEAKQTPKFEIGQRVNIAEEKRVAPNPNYAYGIVIGIDFDVDGTVMYKLLLRSGPYRREISVEEKYLVLAEHAAQPVSEPKFKVGQEVKVTRHDGEVIWANDKSYVADVKTEDGKYRYGIETPGVGFAFGVAETCITAVEEKAKFKAGDRVYLSCEGHCHDKQTGTVCFRQSASMYVVQFDGHDCKHIFSEDSLSLVKFAKGQQVCCDKGYRLAEYKKLEVTGVMGRAGSHLIYQLKATKADGSNTTVSARETALSVAPVSPGVVETQVIMMPKVHHDEAMRWAEGLIMQLPQNQGGRNSWLMNYGSVDKEVLTDPVAVATLLHAKAVIHMTTENGQTLSLSQGMETEMIKACMESGATFIWHRKEKRPG